MQVVHDLNEWRKIRSSLPIEANVGFVPTMGALHAGHASLLKRAREENDIVVLSVYVNPTQFNNPADLEKYPRTLETDVALAESLDVDYVLAPTYQQIYPDGYRYKVTESEFSKQLCGAHRPGHFDGVLTVVMKLLNLVQPKSAYFGEKDFQQLQLIKDMTTAFFMPVEIVPCPTLREADGLAMSSRNVNLSAFARSTAPIIAAALKGAPDVATTRDQLAQAGFDVDYVEQIGNRRYAAATIGGVRLIDNVER